MSRRGPPRYASLTSLLDVLFILLFAALVQSAQLVAQADAGPPAPAPGEAEAQATTDAGIPAVDSPRSPLRERALARLAESMRARRIVYAHVSATGTLVAIAPEDGAHIELGVPLVARVSDPDVGVAYLGDDSAALRICSLVRTQLGLADLDQHIVVIVPERPLVELVVALVEGLRRDQARCLADDGAPAVLLDSGGMP